MSASEVQEGAAAPHEAVATKKIPTETVQEVTHEHEKEDVASSPVTETKDKDSQRPASLAPTNLSDPDDKDTVSLPFLPQLAMLPAPREVQGSATQSNKSTIRASADQRPQP